MAFAQEQTRAAVAIQGISVELLALETSAAASYRVEILMSDGTVVVRTGDLLPHLTPARVTSLNTFMADLRTKAVDEFLP